MLLLPALLVLGFLLVLALVPLAARWGGLRLSAVILIGPFSLWLVFMGLGRARQKWSVLRVQLRWWHWLWFLLLASGFVFRVRDTVSARQSPVDAAALYRLTLVGFTALVLLWRLVSGRTSWMRSLFSGLACTMTVFALVSAVSALWSVNAPWTLYKSLEYLVDLMLLAAIVATLRTVKDYETLFDWNWTLCGLLLVSAWVGAVIWPQEALDAGYSGGVLGVRLSGVLPGQGWNRLGDLGAIVGVVSLCRLLPFSGRSYDRLWYLLLFLFGLATIVLSQTRSALVALAIGGLLALQLTGRLKRGVLLIAGAAGLFAATNAGSLVMAVLQRGQSKAEMASLSDRLNWWSMGWQLLSQHPWTGLGAFAAGPFGVFEKLGLNNVGPLHSDYVETLVGTSFWGLLPLLAALAGCWWMLLRCARDRTAPSDFRQLSLECCAVLAVITIRSVVMTFIVMHPPLNFLVILGFAEALRRRHRYFLRHPAAPVKAIAA